jgi:hypothetical protein
MGIVNVDSFGAVGDGITDDTEAIRIALYSGNEHITFSSGKTYNIRLIEGGYLGLFEFLNIFTITGNGALINDLTPKLIKTITPVFWFWNCHNISVTGLNYIGSVLENPSTDLGYYGSTFVRASHGSSNITVQSDSLQHLRYGVQSGDYTDFSYGGCSGFNINLKTNFCGYSYALYYAHTITGTIHAENTHRAVYHAGCVGVNTVVSCKNQYVAPIQALMTDCFISSGRSRGCQNITIDITDLGSDTYLAASWLAGISLSRVDPTIVYDNINVTVHLTGTDTLSSSIGAFIINSNAINYEPKYPFNFDPWIYINNVTISGTIDRTAQTIETMLQDIYIMAQDTVTPAHFPTVSNLKCKNLNMLSGTNFSAGKKTLRFYIPGLTDTLTLDNCNFTSYDKYEALGSGVEVII